MDLFSEQEFLDSAGIGKEAHRLSERKIVEQAVNKNYGDSNLVTYVSLDVNDWDIYGTSRPRAFNIRLCFTPMATYDEHRKELAQLFPFALVLRAYGSVLRNLKAKAARTLTTLCRQNYIVLPITSNGKHRGWSIGLMPVAESGAMMNIVDAFSGGNIVTDRLRNQSDGRGVRCTRGSLYGFQCIIGIRETFKKFEEELAALPEVI